MRATNMVLVLLLTVSAAPPAMGSSPFAQVPTGAPVRITGAAFRPPLQATLIAAEEDSLRLQPRRGAAFTVPNTGVQSLDYRSDRRPSARLGVLVGIGAGMAGGAVLGAALGAGGREDGGGSGGDGEGGGGEDIREAAQVTAAAVAQPNPSGSATYRAVVGAVLGGIAGGLTARLANFAPSEAAWSTLPGPVSRALGVPVTRPTTVFAVRLPLRLRRTAR